MDRKIELLAPAGNMESFKAAVNAGADAIYMGLGKHNARVMAKNFTLEDYIECLDYAHIRGVKVYLTLNTLVEDSEIKEALDMLVKLYSNGLDAVILQDIGLAYLIHKTMPSLAMHASTQMSAYSLEQVKFLESVGFKRVVLARELTLEEIKSITSNTDVEVEAFVHGALCVSVSGQCLLSLAIGTRSANRGACAQPCRMRYSLASSKGMAQENRYLLSKKDIFGLDILKDIIDANFISLKIEGRNKIPEYTALVVSMYRKYIDKYINGEDISLLKEDERRILQMFNRSGKSHGYLDGVKYKESITILTPKNTGLYLGEVIGIKGKLIKVKLCEDIDMHDGIEIYSKDEKVFSTIVTCIKDSNKNLVNSVIEKGQEVFLGDINQENVSIGDTVYKTSSSSLNQEVTRKYIKAEKRKRELVLNVDIKRNSPITLSCIVNNNMYTFNTNVIPERAINKEITLEDINNCFYKTKDRGISFEKAVGYVEKGLFVRTSVLNEIRRNFITKLEEKYKVRRDIKEVKENLEKELAIEEISPAERIKESEIMSIYKYSSNIKYDELYLKKYNKKMQRIDFPIIEYMRYRDDILSKYGKYDIGVNIPNVTLKNTYNAISRNLESVLRDGVKYVILGSFCFINQLNELKKKYDFKLVADYSFNINNSYAAKFMLENGFDIITVCFDASSEQVERISKIANIELVENYIDVMTSRYCVLGAFVADRDEKCSAPCLQDNYHLIDSYGEKYPVICNNLDCVMKIIKKNKQKVVGKYNYRKNEI